MPSHFFYPSPSPPRLLHPLYHSPSTSSLISHHPPSPSTAVPNAVVVSSPGGELALRLHFEAEHSNVLVVTAELLNGCLSKCEVLTMKMELLQDMYPQFPVSHLSYFKRRRCSIVLCSETRSLIVCSVLQALSSEEYGKEAVHFSKFSYGHDMVQHVQYIITHCMSM